MREVKKEEFLDMQEKNENIMVDLYADWCSPCKMLKPILENITVPNNVNLVSLNYEENQELVRMLNVRSIPTVISFKGKNEINRIVGLKAHNDYQIEINKLNEK
jgi:thioredoxin 1